jgi:hypothetical protein
MTPWSQWSPCNVTCGHAGMKNRSRNVEIAAQFGGKDCSIDDLKETVDCSGPIECPIDCVWSAWQSWSDCSVTCGSEGTMTRKRVIKTKAEYYGTSCGQDFEQSKPCGKPCSKYSTKNSSAG